jgi:hypothetical protein
MDDEYEVLVLGLIRTFGFLKRSRLLRGGGGGDGEERCIFG